MSNQVVKVRRQTLATCMTCYLCNKLFRDATTISECLHTFCRKCIRKKLSEEDSECCPICKIDLGCVPMEKLRSDNNMHVVRAKIFPYKRKKVKAYDVMHSITFPLKRKERSLSSLVVSAPKVTTQSDITQSGMTGRRSKSNCRKPLRRSTLYIKKFINKEEGSAEDRLGHSIVPDMTLNKLKPNVRHNLTSVEPSSYPTTHNDVENGTEEWKDDVDMWRPLNCLVEVANRSKSSRFTAKGSALKLEPSRVSNIDRCVFESNTKENGHKFNVQNEMENNGLTPDSEKPKKFRRLRKKTPAFVDSCSFPNVVIDDASAKYEKDYPIWFSLVASKEQEGDAPLPQISPTYLRIKDGSIPVSFIQKYLVRKLHLMHDDEVEIRCMGQLVAPTLQLNNLIDQWIQMSSSGSDKLSVKIGTSTKDFVMVLVYGRRLPTS
ncbi:unnamed protein product [Cuscuta europaea]|uniref:RING-type domain-containing protein n=1 Tax=Cuscuta europaea TaxID=41803 RepID=A0A9P0YSV2_CUSEU|nr:unnamed protein product [Cuscuta europaea]